MKKLKLQHYNSYVIIYYNMRLTKKIRKFSDKLQEITLMNSMVKEEKLKTTTSDFPETGLDIFQKKETYDKKIRVMTYNLLSSDLVNKEWFPYVNKRYLSDEYRIEKTKKLIESWMKVNFIICLQEVNDKWNEILKEVFEGKYKFISATYYSGTMGVGIAYPANHFIELDTQIYKCSDKIKDIMKNNKKDITLKEMNDQLCYSADIQNIAITLTLDVLHYGESINKRIMITNYHMPCKFTEEYIMLSHLHSLKHNVMKIKKRLEKKYKINGSIIAGDFNMIPNEKHYRYFTEDFTETHEEYKRLREFYSDNEHKLDITTGIRSAYRVLHGKEPEYTNVSKQPDKTFVECLDYIFIMGDISVDSSLVGLKVDNPAYVCYPNGLCPSDHLPLSATLSIA